MKESIPASSRPLAPSADGGRDVDRAVIAQKADGELPRPRRWDPRTARARIDLRMGSQSYWIPAVAVGSVIVTAAVLMLPLQYSLSFTVGLALLLVAVRIPLPVTLVLWGMLLPIWSVRGLPTQAFDIARASLAVIIVLRSAGQLGRPTKVWRSTVLSWAIPLAALGGLTLLASLMRGDRDGLQLGVNMIVALGLVGAVFYWNRNFRAVLVGYFCGAVASAVVLVLQAMQLVDLSPQDTPGYFRATGLAPSSTLVSTELAAAMIVGVVAITRGGRLAALAWPTTAVVLLALLLSGGRVGVAGLLIAVLLALYARWLRAWSTALIGGAVAFAVWLATANGLALFTLDRLIDGNPSQTASDYSSGRLQFNLDGLRAIASEPADGFGLDRFLAETGHSPHTPLLLFGVVGGVAASAIALVLVIRFLFAMARRPRSSCGTVRSCYLIIGVLFSPIVLEPTGPFVGVQMTALLIGSMCVLRESASPQSESMTMPVGFTAAEAASGGTDASRTLPPTSRSDTRASPRQS